MERRISPRDLLVALLLVQSSLERRSEAFFQPHGLSGAQFNILNLLAAGEGRMDQAALVDLLLVGKSSISIVLARMVRDGLVKREEHPRDRRQVVLVLTARGRKIWSKISPRYEASVEKTLGALPASRRRQFFDDLKKLHGAFLDEEPGDDPHRRWSPHFPKNVT